MLGHTCGAQDILLALHSGIKSSGTTWGAPGQTRVGCTQGKSLIHWTISLVSPNSGIAMKIR